MVQRLVYDQYWLGRGLRTAITVQIGFQCVCKNMKLITRMAWKPKLGYCYTMGYLTWVHFSIADRYLWGRGPSLVQWLPQARYYRGKGSGFTCLQAHLLPNLSVCIYCTYIHD